MFLAALIMQKSEPFYEEIEIREATSDFAAIQPVLDAPVWTTSENATINSSATFCLSPEEQTALDSHMPSPPDVGSWNYASSVFYSITIFTTIGYGTITPSTDGGKFYTCILTLLGITQFGLLMHATSQVLTRLLKYCYHRKCYKYTAQRFGAVQVRLLLLVLLLYTLITASLASAVQNWTYGDSFYFMIVTLTTVGLGDFAPDFSGKQGSGRTALAFIVLSFLLLVGLALVSMLLQAVSEAVGESLSIVGLHSIVPIQRGGRNMYKKSSSSKNESKEQMNRAERLKQRKQELKRKRQAYEDDMADAKLWDRTQSKRCGMQFGLVMLHILIASGILLAIEAPHEEQAMDKLRSEHAIVQPLFIDTNATNTKPCMNAQQFEILNRSITRPPAVLQKWSVPSSLFYVVTIFSTVGYGTFGPTSSFGKLYTCILAIVGVAHFGFFLSLVSTNVNKLLRVVVQLGQKYSRALRRAEGTRVAVYGSAAVFFGYIFMMSFFGVGAVNWGFGNGLYFSLITFSTVGLGDYAPDLSQVETASERGILSILLTIALSAGLSIFGILIGAITKVLQARNQTSNKSAVQAPSEDDRALEIEAGGELTNPGRRVDRQLRGQMLTSASGTSARKAQF